METKVTTNEDRLLQYSFQTPLFVIANLVKQSATNEELASSLPQSVTRNDEVRTAIR
jgi:hypothetical protein